MLSSGEALGRAAAPLCHDKLVEVILASDWDASLTAPSRGIQGMSNCKETTGQTQNMIEELYIHTYRACCHQD